VRLRESSDHIVGSLPKSFGAVWRATLLSISIRTATAHLMKFPEKEVIPMFDICIKR
jgi:hypothetical protein